MKIAISGASSFIGMRLIKDIDTRNWDIIAVVREKSKSIPELQSFSNVEIVECNMEDYHSLGEKIGRVDCFMHLSWNGTRGEDRANEKMQLLNYNYGLAAVESMINAGCKRIVTAGSQAEYGPHKEIINESSLCIPNTEYGKYKLKFYEAVKAICESKGISYKEPRYFSLYGPDDTDKTMIISMLKNMIHGEPCELTECIQMWDFLYIDDAIKALIKLCETDCADGVYNFGSGDCRQLKDFVEEMKLLSESNSELLYGAVPYPATGMVSICPDITKLRNETGWSPKISFREGIKTIIEKRFA